ncbi:MAG: ATP-binding protein [Chitinophagia bacterium]|nr:ATP-binding protein [Chitinophagia bacterium]
MKYNAAYMDSILLNFITNAIKYRDPKKKPMAEISAYKTDTELVLVIKDNGIGIDLAEYGHKLFGMYNTFTDNPNSTGIGLFMTRNQIESLGGRITVESEEGVGSTFSIHFALDMSAVLKTPQ